MKLDERQAEAGYRLLALCARAELPAEQRGRLACAAARLTAWETLPAQAEAQGMAPLLYAHLKAAEIEIPRPVRRQLQGLCLRHRQANRERMQALDQILATFEAAGIQALVLKGAALCHLVYPDPGLRPMSDLDLLVPASDLRRAQRLLAGLGFDAPLPPGPTLHRHLPAATRRVAGVRVQVELHHRLFSDYFDNAGTYLRVNLCARLHGMFGRRSGERSAGTASAGSAAWEALRRSALPVALGDRTACTLGLEDTLGHLCRHLVSHVNVWEAGRLIWVADIVSLAERFQSEIDWASVRRRDPAVRELLSLVHWMTPLSDALLARAEVRLVPPPQGMGVAYRGWPRVRLGSWRALRETLWPSEWWLRWHYRVGSARSLSWYRGVRHPLHLLGHVVRVGLERLGWPQALDLAGQCKETRFF